MSDNSELGELRFFEPTVEQMLPHPLANLLPVRSEPEFKAFRADIAANDIREPVIVYEDRILDGRHRFGAGRLEGKRIPYRIYQGNDPLGYVLSGNVHRRSLSKSQLGLVAAEIIILNQNGPQGPIIKTSTAIAEQFGIARSMVVAGLAVMRSGNLLLIDTVRANVIPVKRAASIARLSPDEQSIALEKAMSGPTAKEKEDKEVRFAKTDQIAEILVRHVPNDDLKLIVGLLPGITSVNGLSKLIKVHQQEAVS